MGDHKRRVVVVSASNSASGDDRSDGLGSQGHIGWICARSFALRGDDVTVVDSDDSRPDALGSDDQHGGSRIEVIRADLSKPRSLRKAAADYMARNDGLDVLITAHSELDVASFEASSDASWRRVVDVNLLGAVWAIKAFLPLLKEGRDPAIVNCVSIDGLLGNPQVPSFSVSKGGLITLTHVLAEELASYGIRVNAVARAMIVGSSEPMHPMFRRMIPHTPLGRPALPEEVAAAVRFLSSPDASYITGVTVPVDGGRTAYTPGSRPEDRIDSRSSIFEVVEVAS